MREKQSEVQPEPDIRAFNQETSISEQKNTRARVQRYISQNSDNWNHDDHYGMKNLI